MKHEHEYEKETGMKRRDFFQWLGAAAGGVALSGSLNAMVSGETPAPLSMADISKAGDGKPAGDSYWKMIREQFLLPRDYNYFNTGGLGASPLAVIKRVKEMMDEENTHPAPGHDKEHWLEVKGKCAALLGPGVKTEEIALVSSATEGINTILNGLPLEKGDEVITSTHEHVALHIPLLYKRSKRGIVIRSFTPAVEKGMDNVKRIESLINKRTRLIFISHVTCTTGQVMPVEEIGKLAKDRGLWFALDGAQAAGQFPLGLDHWGVDFYTFSGHKWLLGPKRTGVLFVRKALMDTLEPTNVGAYSNGDFDFAKRALKLHPTAQRYEYGTQNDALFYGLGAALDFVNAVGMKRISRHNRKLAEVFYQGLRHISKGKVDILSPEEEAYRSGVITFRLKHVKSGQVCHGVEAKGFRLRYVSEAHLDAVRVSFHLFNHEPQVNDLLNAIDTL
jgi:selenocysteine lyase/cysteine desulfurase